MKLTLLYFRCYEKATFEFTPGKITLISGPSGIGKSTILQAIYWGLYGSLRHAYHHAHKNEKYSVILEFKDFIIYRQGHPNLLRITLSDGNKYEDKVAQQIIDHSYQSKEIWKSCSYLDQGGRCTLISASNAERMDLLNKLAFGTDTPDQYLEKIESAIKTEEVGYSQKETILQYECDQLTRKLQQKFLPKITPIPENEINTTKLQISTLQSQTLTLEQQRSEQQRLQVKYDLVSSNLMKLKSELQSIPSSPPSAIENIGKTITDLHQRIEIRKQQDSFRSLKNEHISVCQQTESVIDQLNRCDQNWSSHIVNQNDLSQIQFQDSWYNYGIDMCQQYNMPYSKESVKQQITALQQQVTSQQKKETYLQLKKELNDVQFQISQIEFELNKHCVNWNDMNISENDLPDIQRQDSWYNYGINICQKYNIDYNLNTINELKSKHVSKERLQAHLDLQSLETQLTNCESSDLKKIHESEIYNAKQKISQLEATKDILTCPHCSKPVRYHDRSLHKADTFPVSNDELIKAQQHLQILQYGWNNEQYRKNIQIRIDSLNKIRGNVDEINVYLKLENFDQMMQDLSNLQIVKKPKISYNQSQQIIKYQKLNIAIMKIKNQLGLFDSSIENDNFNINEIQSIIQNLSGLTLVDRPKVDYLTAQLIIQHNELNNRKNKLESMLPKIEITEKLTVEELNSMLIHKTQEQQKIDHNEHQRQQLIQSQLELEKQLTTIILIPNIEEKYQNHLKTITELINKLNDSKYIHEIHSQHLALTSKRESLIQQHTSLLGLRRLQSTAIEVECQHLQAAVNGINIILEQLLNRLFEIPITVELRLFKKLKTQKRIKPQINLSVLYRGVEYDSLNYLSGGEADRVSLALIMSLNQVSSSRFLLLDETMSSLDQELRNDCLNGVKELIGANQYAICINHEDTEGEYDSIIRLN